MPVRQPTEDATHRSLDRGVEVNRVDDLHIIALRDAAQPGADLFEAMAKAFAAMPGHQDQLFCRIEEAEPRNGRSLQRRVTLQPRAHGEERVDDRVAGDHDLVSRQILVEQVGPRSLGWREQTIGETVDHAAVHLFGPRPSQIAGAQPGLDMADPAAGIESGKRRRQRRRGVAVHQDPVGLLRGDNPLDAGEHRRRHIDEVLLRLHDSQVMIRGQAKKIEDSCQHVAMLAGQAKHRVERRAGRQRLDHRRHLDRLRAGPEYGENFHRLARTIGGISAGHSAPQASRISESIRSGE